MSPQRKLLTIAEFKQWMEQNRFSPEDVAKRVPLSNMTIRRLIKKEDALIVPPKYQVHLGKLVTGNFDSTETLMGSPESLVVTGMGVRTSDEVVDKLVKDARLDQEFCPIESDSVILSDLAADKRRLERFAPTGLLTKLTRLKKLYPEASKTQRLSILSAVIYVVTPMDLIADAMMGIGFIDDVGVLSVVLSKFKKRRSPPC